MVDLDELEKMLEKAAEPEPSGDDSYYIVETFKRMEFEQKLDATLRNAAPELIKMAKRYQWVRSNPDWETEMFLSGLTPEQYDLEVDKAMASDSVQSPTEWR